MSKAEKWFKKNYPHIKDGGLISSKIIGEVMQQYAEQEGRKLASEAIFKNLNNKSMFYGLLKEAFGAGILYDSNKELFPEKAFREWMKSKQEQQ